MLRNNKLLIDRDCPLCTTYGNGFTRFGLIDSGCALPYQSSQAGELTEIDHDRARNEIALLVTITGETTYGLASIIKILFHRRPLLEKIVNLSPVFITLDTVYKVISYNRNVIAPPSYPSKVRPCIPDFHLAYRWAYIIFVALATALIVNNFTSLLFPHFGWPHSLGTELCICFGQVLWQGTAMLLFSPKNKMTYLGNMSTVSMIGALILLPITMALGMIEASLYLKLALFFGVVGFMFFEHIRRCKLLGISTWMTVSWVAYRITGLSTLIALIIFTNILS